MAYTRGFSNCSALQTRKSSREVMKLRDRVATIVSVIALAIALATSVQAAANQLLHATLAKNRAGEPGTKFRTDSTKIYAFWKGDRLNAGDIIRAVWIAEGIGRTALKDNKITEALGDCV